MSKAPCAGGERDRKMVNVKLKHAIVSNMEIISDRENSVTKEKKHECSTVSFFIVIDYFIPIYHYRLCCFRVQVDVYSFGVLLCEICIRELPDPDRRDVQVAMVTNHRLRALIRRCMLRYPKARPSMEYIIDELEKSV